MKTSRSYMMTLKAGLYIHMPWCIKKCPYCDFNSHKAAQSLPEEAYIAALLEDLDADLHQFGHPQISSIFIGGGTASLFSGKSYQTLLAGIYQRLPVQANVEITMEANPGTFEQVKFNDYLNAGINRLSLGVQSFHDPTLKHLGRIHSASNATAAIQAIKALGYPSFNLDLMYGAPHQQRAMAIDDLKQAIDHHPTHLSWYQFTIEPNTYFFRYPPPLPHEEEIAAIEAEGYALLEKAGYQRYEISAFARPGYACQHNLNYWTFGDYFGIGAGAHGKLTQSDQQIKRTQKHRLPQTYLDAQKPYLVEQKTLTIPEICFEFLLNTTRLEGPISYSLFSEKTGLPIESIGGFLSEALEKQLITVDGSSWQVTPLGRRFTNELQLIALPE